MYVYSIVYIIIFIIVYILKWCVFSQEGEPVGSSVLQLVVTDKDTPKNGNPFSFHIVSGNEGRRFHIDQGGLLSLAGPLKKKTKAHHLLKVQVRQEEKKRGVGNQQSVSPHNSEQILSAVPSQACRDTRERERES